MRLRPATAGDVDAIAALHADSWRRSYRGAVRDEYLDGDIVPERTALWRGRLAAPDAAALTLVAVDDATDGLIGFAHTVRDVDPTWGSLLDNLHVSSEHRREGIGASLLRATASWVAATASASPSVLHLWVLESNPGARRFYETLGAADVGGDVWEPPGGGSTPRRRYAWTDLAALA